MQSSDFLPDQLGKCGIGTDGFMKILQFIEQFRLFLIQSCNGINTVTDYRIHLRSFRLKGTEFYDCGSVRVI